MRGDGQGENGYRENISGAKPFAPMKISMLQLTYFHLAALKSVYCSQDVLSTKRKRY